MSLGYSSKYQPISVMHLRVFCAGMKEKLPAVYGQASAAQTKRKGLWEVAYVYMAFLQVLRQLDEEGCARGASTLKCLHNRWRWP